MDINAFAVYGLLRCPRNFFFYTRGSQWNVRCLWCIRVHRKRWCISKQVKSCIKILVTSRLCTIPNHTVERQPVTATSCQLQKKKFLLKPPSTCGIHIQCATSVALSNKLNFSAAKKLPQTGDSPVVVGSPLFGASLSLAGCRLTWALEQQRAPLVTPRSLPRVWQLGLAIKHAHHKCLPILLIPTCSPPSVSCFFIYFYNKCTHINQTDHMGCFFWASPAPRQAGGLLCLPEFTSSEFSPAEEGKEKKHTVSSLLLFFFITKNQQLHSKLNIGIS